MKIYLCGPINGCTDSEAIDWRANITEHFPESINPMTRDYRGVEDIAYREIVDLDKRDIRRSDIVLVNYVRPSVGTSMEIFYAWSLGTPVVVWCDADASLSPWLRYHATAFARSLNDVIETINRVAG